jgi:transcription-repair coupling factor (superfamily II helicase)
MNAVRLRAIARDLGFEKIVLKQGTLVTYFISNQSSAFYSSIEFQKLMQIVARNKNTMRMKEKNNKLSLVLEKVKTIRQALDMLGKLRAEVQATPAT